MSNKIPLINPEDLENVSGGSIYTDLSAEEILAATRENAIWWKEQGRSKEQALDLLSRYMYTPGKVEREAVDRIIIEVYS